MKQLARRGPMSVWPAVLNDLAQVDSQMNRWMNHLAPMRALSEAYEWLPEVDLIDVDGEYILTAETPGMKKEDIEVEVQDGVLTLSGEKKETNEQKSAHHRFFERRYGSFERSLPLPLAVDPDKVRAEYEDGVLTVHLPKTEETRGRKVKIS